MTLPDLTRLIASPPGALRAFGRAFASVGLTLAAAEPVVSAVKHLDPALRGPARAFLLRRLREPVGDAMRMFLFNDPVTDAEARAAFGGATDELVAVGLLERREAGVVSPFVLGIVDDLFILSDALERGEDAVMGLGGTTITLGRAAFPREPVGRALDLGCGAGTCALLLSKAASAVVGTDINPRAVALSRINAALNGCTGVEFREGDRFAPVAGETFDLVVSQPPFVARPEGAGDSSALYGGHLGDELALSILAALPAHLTPAGRAVFVVEWPMHGDAPLEQGVRDALGNAVNLLMLRAPPVDVASYAVAYASGFHPRLGPAFEADALTRLEHLARAGIRELAPTLLVVQSSARAPGWTSTIAIEPLVDIALDSARIDGMLAAHALRGQTEPLLSATLRVPRGTIFTQSQTGPGAEVPSTLSARFAPEAALRPIDMTMELLLLITLVHEAGAVRDAIPRYAEALELSLEDALAQALPIVESALLHGILELPEGPSKRSS